MKRIILCTLLLMTFLPLAAKPEFGQQPRLVVGIVVDQMRWDYLSRYYDRFEKGGFRRLIDEGYSCDNCLINYLPTITAIGHTSAYTGTTPALHGICGNNFYVDGRKVYCTADSTVQGVGTKSNKGKMSPRNMLATTIGDQLRMHTNFRSKVIGVSYKDRAAILPAGHSANAAFWLDPKLQQFVTSTYYMQALPEWAASLNSRLAENEAVRAAGDSIGYKPLCGTITTDMAIAALEGERLGKGKTPDMLCISYSQTDVIGHEWGTRGQRTDDAYLQLDRDLARLLAALDRNVGKGKYLLFLTADHAACHNRAYLSSHHLPTGRWMSSDIKKQAEAYVAERLRATAPVISDELDYRFFLDRASIARQGLDYEEVKATLMEFLRSQPHVSCVIDFERAAQQSIPPILRDRALMGYHYRRSGDILVVLDPGYYTHGTWSSPGWTTHGSWNPYDSHIPLLFFGWNVPHGATSHEVHITDIAPTICQMLHIQQPSACIGEPIIF